jgi:hypothetical protein
MKIISLIIMIVVFLLLYSNGMQGQTTQTKLDQIEFCKQFLGTWKTEMGKDTIGIYTVTPFGDGSERSFTLSTKGKIINSGKELYGYNKKNDKIIGVKLWKSSPDITIDVWWATSKNTSEGVPFEDISNPGNAALKMKCDIKSPDLFIITYLANNKVVSTMTFSREKK